MIHDVITIANHFPYTAEFMLEIIKLNKGTLKDKKNYAHSVVV